MLGTVIYLMCIYVYTSMSVYMCVGREREREREMTKLVENKPSRGHLGVSDS